MFDIRSSLTQFPMGCESYSVVGRWGYIYFSYTVNKFIKEV